MKNTIFFFKTLKRKIDNMEKKKKKGTGYNLTKRKPIMHVNFLRRQMKKRDKKIIHLQCGLTNSTTKTLNRFLHIMKLTSHNM